MWKVIRVGVTWANKTHLKLGTLSGKNGITVPATEAHLCRNRVHLIKKINSLTVTRWGEIMSSPSYTLTTQLTSAGAFFKPRHRPLVYQPSTVAQNNKNRAAVMPRRKGFYWILLHRQQPYDSEVYKTQICLYWKWHSRQGLTELSASLMTGEHSCCRLVRNRIEGKIMIDIHKG